MSYFEPLCMNLSPDSSYLESFGSWQFDALAVQDRLRGQCGKNLALQLTVQKAVSSLGLVQTLGLSHRRLARFMRGIEDGYVASNPYHNSAHAADVVSSMYHLLVVQDMRGWHTGDPSSTPGTPGGEGGRGSNTDSRSNEQMNRVKSRSFEKGEGGLLSPLQMYGALVAGAIHDFKHPGRSNIFLVFTGDPIAIRYNDKAVLENYHVAEAFALAAELGELGAVSPEREPKVKEAGAEPGARDPFFGLSARDRGDVRQTIVELVLATDLSTCFSYVTNLKAVKAAKTVEEYRSRAANVLHAVIRASDVGHSAKETWLHLKWARLVVEENFRQGDEEKKREMAVSPYHSRCVGLSCFVWLVGSLVGSLLFLYFVVACSTTPERFIRCSPAHSLTHPPSSLPPCDGRAGRRKTRQPTSQAFLTTWCAHCMHRSRVCLRSLNRYIALWSKTVAIGRS